MANSYKVLGQSYPLATTNTDIYTVGAGKSAVVSTIAICNQTGNQLTYNIAIRIGGSTLATSQYLAYSTPINGNTTTFITIGATLTATDVITVYASTQGLSFSVFGTEIS